MDPKNLSRPTDARATETTTPSPAWLNAREAAAHARCGVALVYSACAGRRLRHVRLAGRALRFKRVWIDEWVLSQAVEVAPLMEDRR
jgi:hypothetical protein